MNINFNTAVKGLEKWTAPKEIQKSGFGELKVEGQDVTVCAKVVGDIHKIGAQLRNLRDMNTSQGQQNWKGNKAVVRQLDNQIKALGATLDEMKGASSNLKTHDDIKAAIQFTKHIAAKANQIEHALKEIEGKLDKTTIQHLLEITKILESLTDKNNEVRDHLTNMKVTKHVEPEARSKVDFLKVYAGVNKLPGIGKFIKAFTGLFVDLNAKVKTRLDTQLASLETSLKQLNRVSGNITSSTEAGELLKRTQEAKDRLADFSGIALAVTNSSNNFDLLSNAYAAETQTKNMLGELSQLQTTLEQKQELFKQQEALAPIKLDFDRTHEFDISSARTLLSKLEECNRDLLAATQGGIAPENEQINQNLLTHIDALSIRATLRLEQFGLITKDEAGLESYQVTVKKLEKQYQELQRELGYVAREASKNPGLAQHIHIRLSERITQFEELQEHTQGEKPDLTVHKTHVRELRTALKESEVIIRRNLQLEATHIKGQTEGLTGIFEALNQLAADLQTPETVQLKEIKAHQAVANGIYNALLNNPVQRESPNYQKYNDELFRAREAVAMAGELISNVDEKIVLEDVRTSLSKLEKERANLLKPDESLENSAAQQHREKSLTELSNALQAIESLLIMIAPEKTSPNKALFDNIELIVTALRGEVDKNYSENQVGILTNEIFTLSEEVGENFAKATLDGITRWQEDVARHETNLNKILAKLPDDQRTNEISAQLSTSNATAADLKNLLADRKTLIETRDRLNEINNLIEQKIINNNDINVQDRLVLLQYQIEISLPDMKASLAGVSAANQPGTGNFADYRQLTDDMNATLENLKKIQIGYERSPKSFPKLEEFGKNTQKQITKKIEDISANVTLTAGERHAELQKYQQKLIPDFQRLSESLTTFLPRGKELSTLKGGNANRVQALTTLVENQLQATADLVANMKTAKTEIEAIDLLGQQISHDVEAPSREVWKLRKLDQKDALDRLAKLEESLNQLGKCQVTAEEGSIERTEINRAIAKGASLIVRYRISIAQKSSDDILQELDNIRFDEELSLPEINKNLEALNQKLNNLQDFLTQAKINEKNIEEISNNLKGTISTDRRLINGIGFSTQEINLVLKELDNYEGGKFDQALQNVIISLNNASKGWKESKDKNHYSHHFEKLLNQLHTVNNLHQWRVKQGILDYKRPEGWKLSYW